MAFRVLQSGDYYRSFNTPKISYLLHGAHGSSMPTVQSSFGKQNQSWPSESSDLSPPSLGWLGWSAQAPALSCRRPQRCEGPERDLQWARRRRSRRGGGRRRGRGRGEERERRGPGSAVRRRLGWSGGGKGWGRCEGRHPVDGGQSRRREEWRCALLAPAQGGEAEGGGRRVAPKQGQIPSPTGERRWGGGLWGGGDLREGRPRPRRKGQGGGRGRL